MPEPRRNACMMQAPAGTVNLLVSRKSSTQHSSIAASNVIDEVRQFSNRH
jgi:hypothetical protein